MGGRIQPFYSSMVRPLTKDAGSPIKKGSLDNVLILKYKDKKNQPADTGQSAP
jgi:hypothetical protein